MDIGAPLHSSDEAVRKTRVCFIPKIRVISSCLPHPCLVRSPYFYLCESSRERLSSFILLIKLHFSNSGGVVSDRINKDTLQSFAVFLIRSEVSDIEVGADEVLSSM